MGRLTRAFTRRLTATRLHHGRRRLGRQRLGRLHAHPGSRLAQAPPACTQSWRTRPGVIRVGRIHSDGSVAF